MATRTTTGGKGKGGSAHSEVVQQLSLLGEALVVTKSTTRSVRAEEEDGSDADDVEACGSSLRARSTRTTLADLPDKLR